MVFRVQPRCCVGGNHRVGCLVAAFAGLAFAVAVDVGGLVVGGFCFRLAGDPLEKFGHDGGAGAEDDGCEFAHAGGIVSIRAREGTRMGGRRDTHFHSPTLMMEYVSSDV